MMIDPEELRPRYHFTPPQNWMNDPNGLIYADGVYHLYYQHNPYGTEWGHMSWGHATSSDLFHWHHCPVAMPEEPEEGYTIFSGSAVVDHANSSGLGGGGAPPLVAVYTADYATRDPQLQDVHLAYSLDAGQTFTQYAGNPVISAGERKFGDPKVFWHGPTQRWVMVNICGLGQGHMVFYGSPDLLTWTQLSEFHAPGEAPGVWECPDLFPLPVQGAPDEVRWVLKVNCVTFGGGRSGTRYFVGEFDGTSFTDAATAGESLTSDDGAIYAEVSYNDVPDGRRILVGWLRQRPHDARPWTGAQSVPRVLWLRRGREGIELCHAPVAELEDLRRERCTLRDHVLAEPLALDQVDVSNGALEVGLVLDLRGATEGGLRLVLVPADAEDRREEVLVGVSGANRELFIVTASGEHIATPLPLTDRPVTLRVLLDQEIVEAFVDDTAGVTGFLPYGSGYAALEVYGRGVAPHLVRADVWTLVVD